MTDNDIVIGMLAAYACFSKDEHSELFGFWYFKEMGLPSTKDEKQSFFHDLMTERCCQLSLKGSLEQIWEIIEVTGQGGSKMPPYPKLWVSKNGERKGYMPACANDGVYTLCGKRKTPRVRCSDCNHQPYLYQMRSFYLASPEILQTASAKLDSTERRAVPGLCGRLSADAGKDA